MVYSFYNDHQCLTNHLGIYFITTSECVHNWFIIVSKGNNNLLCCNAGYHPNVPYLSRYSEENALVPHGEEGSSVLYQGPLNPMKKINSLPQVDLDDETKRVWRLHTKIQTTKEQMEQMRIKRNSGKKNIIYSVNEQNHSLRRCILSKVRILLHMPICLFYTRIHNQSTILELF